MSVPLSPRSLALLLGGVLVVVAVVLLPGGPVVGCLGPLGVTQVECTLGYNIANDPDWSPDPGLGAVLAAAVVGLILAGVAVPLGGLSRRTAAVLALVGFAGGVAGIVAYEAIRLRVLSGSTSSGRFLSLVVPSNPDSIALGAIAGAALALVAAGVTLHARIRRHVPGGG